MFDVSPLHTYQRKFSSDDLEEALRFSHIYIISRRPPVRIVDSSTRHGSARFTFQVPIGTQVVQTCHEIGYEDTPIREANCHESGQYFSFVAGNQILHGDSWALLSLLTNAHSDIASHEVLYIGMSFGTGGERNVSHRLKNHATLQAIYEDHADSDWDIFVTAVEVKGNSSIGTDHIDDAEDGFELTGYLKHFSQPSKIAPRRSELSRVSVKLIEHILISTFKPHYNKNLLRWSSSEPTEEMRIAHSIGFRLLTLSFDGTDGLTRFISAEHPTPERSHFFRASLTSHPLSSPTTYDPFNAFGIMSNLHLRVADSIRDSDRMPAVLSIFGAEAPEIRRPPNVHF